MPVQSPRWENLGMLALASGAVYSICYGLLQVLNLVENWAAFTGGIHRLIQ